MIASFGEPIARFIGAIAHFAATLTHFIQTMARFAQTVGQPESVETGSSALLRLHQLDRLSCQVLQGTLNWRFV